MIAETRKTARMVPRLNKSVNTKRRASFTVCERFRPGVICASDPSSATVSSTFASESCGSIGIKRCTPTSAKRLTQIRGQAAARRDADFEFAEFFVAAPARLCGAEPVDTRARRIDVHRKSVPALADPHRAFDRRIARAADDDRRTARLHRPRPRLNAGKADEAAVECRLIVAPQHAHRADELVGARAAIGKWNTECAKFGLEVTRADTEDQTPARQHVEARHLLREHDGIALRDQHDAGAELDAFGDRGEIRQHRRRMQHRKQRRRGRRRLSADRATRRVRRSTPIRGRRVRRPAPPVARPRDPHKLPNRYRICRSS